MNTSCIKKFPYGGVNAAVAPVGRADDILALWVKVVPMNPPLAADEEEPDDGAVSTVLANALKVCGI